MLNWASCSVRPENAGPCVVLSPAPLGIAALSQSAEGILDETNCVPPTMGPDVAVAILAMPMRLLLQGFSPTWIRKTALFLRACDCDQPEYERPAIQPFVLSQSLQELHCKNCILCHRAKLNTCRHVCIMVHHLLFNSLQRTNFANVR